MTLDGYHYALGFALWSDIRYNMQALPFKTEASSDSYQHSLQVENQRL